MVLPASSAHDQPPEREARWIRPFRVALRLSKDGVLLLVDHARPERLGELVRALLVRHSNLDVITNAQLIPRLPDGSTVVFLPKAEEGPYLNEIRPLLAQRKLNVLLFSDRDTTIALRNSAPDFLDWISNYQECPEGPIPFAVAGVRSAIAANALGIHWTGADDDVAGVWQSISAAFPEEPLTWLIPQREYQETLDELRNAKNGWVGCRTRAETHVRKFRWTLAETEKRGRAVLVTPMPAGPGFWPVHNRQLPLAEAAEKLAIAGATHPFGLAAMVDMEPEAVEMACMLLKHGMTHNDFVALLAGVDDPGAVLAKAMAKRGCLDEAKTSWPPILRAMPERFSHEIATVDKQAPKELEQLGAWIEGRIRQGLDAQGWAEMAEQAVKLGDNDTAAAWAVRSIELSGKILAPVRKLDLGYRGKNAQALSDAHKQERNAIRDEPESWRFSLLWVGMNLAVPALIGSIAAKFNVPALYLVGLAAGVGIFFSAYVVVPAFYRGRALNKLHIQIDRNQLDTYAEDIEYGDDVSKVPPQVKDAVRAYQDGRFMEVRRTLDKTIWSEDAPRYYPGDHPAQRWAIRFQIRASVDIGKYETLADDLVHAIVTEGRIVGISRASFIELMIELALVQQRRGDMQGAMALLVKPLASGRVAEWIGPVPNTPPTSLPFKDPEAIEYVHLYVAQPGPLEKVRPEMHARALRILAESMLSQGRYEEANLVAQEAQMKDEGGKPFAALEFFRALGIQGRACALAGRYEAEGKTFLQNAVAMAETTVGKTHIDTARLLLELTRMAHRHGDIEAKEWAKRTTLVYAQIKDDELRSEREGAFAELTRIAG